MTTYQFVIALIAGLPGLITAIAALMHSMQKTQALNARMDDLTIRQRNIAAREPAPFYRSQLPPR